MDGMWMIYPESAAQPGYGHKKDYTLGSLLTLRSHPNYFTGNKHIEKHPTRTVGNWGNCLLHQLSRDEPLPNSIVKKWLHIREDLTNLDRISIPRKLGIQEESVVEVHGFLDAPQHVDAPYED